MISFIIPAYNAEKYIERCLASIVSQTDLFEYEVLVIDDGSKDNTGTVVAEMAQKYPQIKYHHKANGGVSSARNYGLELCNGDHVVFLDADDYLAENSFAHLTGYEEFDLTVFGYFYKLSAKTIPIAPAESKVYADDPGTCFVEIYRSNLFNSVWNKIYKKSLITELFDKNYVMGEDLLFNINYYKNLHQIRVVDQPLYYYFVNENSVTQKYNQRYIYNFVETYQALKELQNTLHIAEFPDIEVALIDNVAGTIRLLVFNHKYRDCISELNKIYKIVMELSVKEKSKSLLHNSIYYLLRKKCFVAIFFLYRVMKVLKSIKR